MKNNILKFIKDNYLKIIMSILVVWVFASPFILTKCLSVFSSTGPIGDTIGGITAPAIGLVSAFLLYMALTKQTESNKAAEYESSFKLIYNEIEKFKLSINEYNYASQFGTVVKGEEAIKAFAHYVSSRIKIKFYTDLEDKLEKYNIVFGRFNRLFYLMNNLHTSNTYKIFLGKEILQLYQNVFQDAYLNAVSKWEIHDCEFEHTRIKISSTQHHFRDINLIIANEYQQYSSL